MVISLNYGFWELFGQIGATMVSIIATLFVGYLLYLKEQRDRIGNEIIELKRRMSSIIDTIRETPIPRARGHANITAYSRLQLVYL